MSTSPSPPRRGGWYEASRYAAIGIEMAASVIIGLLMGMGLDRLFGTGPWLALVFLLFGAVAGFRALFRTLRAWQREEEREGGPPAGDTEAASGPRTGGEGPSTGQGGPAG